MTDAEYVPGAVLHLPAEPDDLPPGTQPHPEIEKEEPHPYVLLTPCRDHTKIVTLAFCSTKDVQAVLGAPHVEVKERSRLFTATGLDKTTFVYPSQLVTSTREDLRTFRGRLMDQLTQLSDNELPRALGYGTGAYGGRGLARASLRGVVMQLNEEGQEEASTDHVIIVADPFYSNQREFLNAIPLFPATADIQHIEPDIVFPDSLPWVRQLGMGAVIAAVRFVWGLHFDDHVLRPRSRPVDEESMALLDAGLREWFDGTGW